MSGGAAWKESISLEETNKIRVSLGLKPISEGPSTIQTPEEAAEANFARRREADAAERNAAALKARIDKAKNDLDRKRTLVGVGLGAAPSEAIKTEEGEARAAAQEEIDNKRWVKQQKKRAKELAAKRAKELEEMDKRFAEEGLAKYGEDDLKGLKVAHGEEDFEEGEDVVLTLKDSRVLDDEDDELHNLNISENSKTAEALALKKKGSLAGAYTGYDDDEFEGGVGSKRGVLNKYDEEIEGREEGGFRLGAPVVAKKARSKGKVKVDEEMPQEKEKVKLTLDYTKTFTTDYLQEDEVGFKVKKKKKRPARAGKVDFLGEEQDPNAMAIDSPSTAGPSSITRANLDETNLIDDDDLQASLARARREVNKKRIQEMKTFAANAPLTPNGMEVDRVKAESEDEEEKDDDVIVMDDTSEFVRNITLAAAKAAEAAAIKAEGLATPAVVAPRVGPAPPTTTSNGLVSVAPRIKAEQQDDVPLSEVVVGGWGPAREDGEESDEEMGDVEADVSDIPGKEDEDDAADVKPLLDDGSLPSTGSEALVSRGMASTLSLLRSQGLLKPRTPEELALDQAQKEKDKWLAEQRRRDVEREAERQRAREAGSSKDQQQREYENRMRDLEEARKTKEMYENYQPVVNITYHDEFGRDQTPKEAWKQLSHSFHGHGTGTKKTQKRLDKIADEQKRKAMASGDTPLSTATAFAMRAERLGTATMVLSVGNKGAAPIQEEMLDNLKKETASNKSKAKGKGKAVDTKRESTTASSSTAVFSDIPMRPLPLPAGESRSGSPAIRGGFAPVRSFSPAVGSGESSTMPTEKFAIVPIAVKRKRTEDGGGPPGKK